MSSYPNPPPLPPLPEGMLIKFDGESLKVEAVVKRDKLKQLRRILESIAVALEPEGTNV